MSEVYKSIVSGLEEAVTLKQITDIFNGIPVKRILELAAAEREGRAYVSQYPNCGMCKWVMIDMFATIEPCKSCRDRAIAEAALAGKGE